MDGKFDRDHEQELYDSGKYTEYYDYCMKFANKDAETHN